ncbi:hypothetical protein [Arthrobacter sp. TMS1-12-1]
MPRGAVLGEIVLIVTPTARNAVAVLSAQSLRAASTTVFSAQA